MPVVPGESSTGSERTRGGKREMRRRSSALRRREQHDEDTVPRCPRTCEQHPDCRLPCLVFPKGHTGSCHCLRSHTALAMAQCKSAQDEARREWLHKAYGEAHEMNRQWLHKAYTEAGRRCFVCREPLLPERAVFELRPPTRLEDHDEWVICHGCGCAVHCDCCQPENHCYCKHCQMDRNRQEPIRDTSRFARCIQCLPAERCARGLRWLFQQ